MTWRADLDRLEARLGELRGLSARFAAMTSAPLAASALAAFEAAHQISLDESHRAWLLRFGEQPIVPGLVGGRALGFAACTEDDVYRCFRGPLDEPFAYAGTEPVALAWDEVADEPVDPAPLRGTLCLGSAGCDNLWVVVVSGPERGKVWAFVAGHDEELQPTGLTVPAWHLAQVERQLAEVRGWLGRAPR